jgi:hypothetical protein
MISTWLARSEFRKGDAVNDQKSPPSLLENLENLEKQVTVLKLITSGLVVLLVGAFGAGVFWTNLLGYEHRVNKLEDDLRTVTKSIDQFKMNIGQLGDPSYETEVTDEQGSPGVPGGSRCERGNVVTGARYAGDGKRLWIQCASVNRAVWNPYASEQAQK